MRTKRQFLFRWVPLVVPIILIATSASVAAQDQQGGGIPRESDREAVEFASFNRVLFRTHFKTVNAQFLNLTTTFVNAFSNTTVLCPGTSGTCTIAVTVSSQFGQVDPGTAARARVFVNGVLAHPGDACCLNMSNNAGNAPHTATMTFVARNVPVGNRVVQVQFSTSGGTAYADYRSLTIQVYRP